jgi:septum site-determining protein MinC
MIQNVSKSQAFKLKGRLYTFTVIQIVNPQRALLSQQLAELVKKAPKMFEQTPVVLDFSSMGDKPCDLHELCTLLREHGMIAVAIQGGDALLHTIAQSQGLALLHGSSAHDKAMLDEIQETPVVDHTHSKSVHLPVRSGQQVVAKGGDLIVTASVSHGAELLADGHIHVYGALRGRALAGISGDKSARIFCQSLDAELVSIAGCYRLKDAIEPQHGPCQIYLEEEHIRIEPL